MPGIQFAAADESPQLRVAACEALGKVGDSAAVDILAVLVEHDEEIDVRLAATSELASFSNPPSLRALGIALDDPNPALQFRAMQSLKVASGRHFGDDIAMWKSWIRGEEPIEPAPSVAEQMRKLWVF
jgi:HEAT repeat protein